MSDVGKVNDLLAQILRGEKKGLLSAHLRNSSFCGDIDIRIARDGSWFYLGTPIGRKSMMEPLSSITHRDGDDYFPAAPVERVGVRVDDVPFVVVTLQARGEGGAQVLRFAINVGDEVEADTRHSLRVEIDPYTQEPTSYLRVRDNLEALVYRNVLYQLVELAVPRRIDGIGWLGIWSHGEFFPTDSQPD